MLLWHNFVFRSCCGPARSDFVSVDWCRCSDVPGMSYLCACVSPYPLDQDETSWLRIGTLVQKRCGVDVLLHLTCHLPVDALKRILHAAREAGIQNILALRGGPSMGQTGHFRPVPGGLKNAIGELSECVCV